MSMYAELLLAALEQQPDHATTEDQLARLFACRRRLKVGATHPLQGGPSEQLAENLAYDLALMQVCLRAGIACEVPRFSRPLVERKRLEEELTKLGFDLDGPPEPVKG